MRTGCGLQITDCTCRADIVALGSVRRRAQARLELVKEQMKQAGVGSEETLSSLAPALPQSPSKRAGLHEMLTSWNHNRSTVFETEPII